MPVVLSENPHAGIRPEYRVTLPSDGLDESRLAATIRAENSDVLSALDTKREAVKNRPASAKHLNIVEIEESRPLLVHSP